MPHPASIAPWFEWLPATTGFFILALIVLVLGWALSSHAAHLIRRLLPYAYGVDKNFAPLLSEAARYGIIILAVVTALNFVGVSSTSILAVLGAAGLAVALALQNTLANIAAGIMLIWQRPVAIGEYITGDGVEGVVVEIGLFGTRLRSSSGLYIFTPNQRLWNSAITNHSREPRRRLDVRAVVPGTIDIERARAILLQIAGGDKRVLADPAPSVHVEGIAGDTITLQLRAWVATPDYLPGLHALTEGVKLGLNREMAEHQGGEAEVSLAADPHLAARHGAEPGPVPPPGE